MPKKWDEVRQALIREGKSENSAAALASAITGYVRKKGGGWRYSKALGEKTKRARKAAWRKALR